jgi:hydrogenase small subunit
LIFASKNANERKRPELVSFYGRPIRKLRGITNDTINREPAWRRRSNELLSGYEPATY